MIEAALDNQIMITVENKVGTLAEITELIASSGINLVAVCGYAVEKKGFIMFVTEEKKKAEEILKKNGFEVRTEEVVVLTLDNKPGALQHVCDCIANAGIDLDLIYGSVERKGKASRIILVSEDNPAVVKIIRMLS